ncbi:MAG: monovalent cation/H(+) antiporter subunit G [Bradymonadia bacterium]
MTTVFEVFDYLSWFGLVAGGFFCVVGGIGLLRLPDFYCRTHGATITDTLGAGLILFGLFFQAAKLMVDGQGNWVPDAWVVGVKVLFIGLLILLTSPTSGHALVKAAYADGTRWQEGDSDALSD